MKINERIAGRICVLDLYGALTWDEPFAGRVKHALDRGLTNILLNLAGVPYVNSLGLGSLVRSFTLASRAGGHIKLVNLTRKIQDLLTITKLLTVFETFDSEADALASFRNESLIAVCPICGADGAWSPEDALHHACASCTARFLLRDPPQDGRAAVLVVAEARLPTYEQEWVVLRAEWPYVLSFDGRLDLFSAEALEQAWRILPRPRKALLELGAESVSPTKKGLARVAALCDRNSSEDAIVVWLGEKVPAADNVAAGGARFFTERSAALDALQSDGIQGAPLLIQVRQRGQ